MNLVFETNHNLLNYELSMDSKVYAIDWSLGSEIINKLKSNPEKDIIKTEKKENLIHNL